MRDLWTFDTREKLETFLALLEGRGIAFELRPAGGPGPREESVVTVDERDYEKARRILLKHRKRRTSGDLA